MNLRKQLIFLTLLVLLVGVVNAAEVGDTTSTDDVSTKTMHKTSTVTSTDIVKENTNINNNFKRNKQNNKTVKEYTTNVIEKDNDKVVDKQSEENALDNKEMLSNVSSVKEDATITLDENVQNSTNVLIMNDTDTKIINGDSNTVYSLNVSDNSVDDLNKVTKEVTSLTKKNNDLVKEWSILDTITENLNKISKEISTRLKDSEGTLVDTMKNLISTLNNTSRNLTEQLNNVREKIDSIKSEDADINQQIKNVNNVLNNLTQFNKNFAEKLADYNGKVPEVVDNIISSLNDTNKDLTEKINDLIKNGFDYPDEVINTLNKLNSTLNDLIKNGVKLPDEITGEISKLNNTFNDLVSKIGGINKDFNVTDILRKLNNTNFTDLIKKAEGGLQKIGDFINSLFNKPLKTTITVNPVKSNVGSVTKLSANIVDAKGKNVTDGRIFFKVNGLTLKDKSNNVLYGMVSNGTASINYKVQDSWIKNTTYIEAIYGGSDKYASSRTNSTQALNIAKGTAKLTLQNPSITAKSGDSITLTARVKDVGGDAIKTGKVIFKLNGKTITDEKGKALFAKVVNGEAVLNYVIPTKYTAKKYTITAVYGGDYYERTEAKGTLTLQKKGVTINTDNVLAVKGKVSVKATITDESGKLLVTSTKLTIKINGKTALSNVNSSNGKIDVNFTTTLRPGMYELLIISGENGIYKTGRMTTVLYVIN